MTLYSPIKEENTRPGAHLVKSSVLAFMKNACEQVETQPVKNYSSFYKYKRC